MTDKHLPIYKLAGKLFLQGLSMVFTMLWLATFFDKVFSVQGTWISPYAVLSKTCIIFAGLFLALLIDRFVQRSHHRYVGIFALAMMITLSVLAYTVSFNAIVSFALAFVAAMLMTVQLLPFFKQGLSGKFFVGLLSASLLCALLAGLPGRALWLHFHELTPLHMVLCGALAAAGFLLRHFTLQKPVDAPTVLMPDEKDPSLSRPLMVTYCIAVFVACVFMIVMLATRFGQVSANISALSAAIVLVFAVLQAAAFLMLLKKRYWMFSYIVLVSFFVGLVSQLICGSEGLLFYLSIMFIVAAVGGLAPLLMLLVFETISPPNRPLGVSVVFVLLHFLFLLFFEPVSRDISLFIVDVEWIMLGVPTLVILLLPVFMRSVEAVPSMAQGEGGESAAQAQEPSAAESDFGEKLTTAEKRVYELILQCYSNQQIADMLYISINTVKFHIRNILAKGDVQKKSQLISKYHSDS